MYIYIPVVELKNSCNIQITPHYQMLLLLPSFELMQVCYTICTIIALDFIFAQ